MSLFSFSKSLIQYIAVIFSLLTNTLLILLVISKAPKRLGNYRHLLCYFSAISMVYAVLDWTVQPYLYSYGASFSMIMDLRNSVFEFRPTIAFLLTASLAACFGVTIYAIAINFIYRFFALQKEGRTNLFYGKRLLLWLLIPVLGGLSWLAVGWFLLPYDPVLKEYLKDQINASYGLDAEKITFTGCLYYRKLGNGEVQWSLKNIIGAVSLSILMNIPFVTILVIGSKSYTKIMELISRGESEYSRKLQTQLFKALVAQTAIPMIFLFFPIGVLFSSPLLGLDIEKGSVIVTFFYSFYPAVDPIPIIYYVDEFRNAVINVFRRKFLGNQVVSVISLDPNHCRRAI